MPGDPFADLTPQQRRQMRDRMASAKEERCENCRRPSFCMRYDVEGVPLCPECWRAEQGGTDEQ